jgi:hypothetical protein
MYASTHPGVFHSFTRRSARMCRSPFGCACSIPAKRSSMLAVCQKANECNMCGKRTLGHMVGKQVSQAHMVGTQVSQAHQVLHLGRHTSVHCA